MGQRLPDLPLNVFLSLGGHVEVSDNTFHKPAAKPCRDKAGDAENGLRSTNRLLLVRLIDAGSRAREDLCEK
jgi:hypothetical protein